MYYCGTSASVFVFGYNMYFTPLRAKRTLAPPLVQITTCPIKTPAYAYVYVIGCC